ncbi:MAG: hypothetical protein HC830_12320 [Bacteroidetes bacterium]|nr:hypothetical protein [Bacteroidota bacterium]
MNNKTCLGKTIMQRISPQAMTGIIGHELGHIVDYSKHTNFGLVKLLIGYISRQGRIHTELRADQIAVEHNLGRELLEFTEHIYQDACMNPKYIRYKRKYYNTPASLGNLVNKQD